MGLVEKPRHIRVKSEVTEDIFEENLRNERLMKYNHRILRGIKFCKNHSERNSGSSDDKRFRAMCQAVRQVDKGGVSYPPIPETKHKRTVSVIGTAEAEVKAAQGKYHLWLDKRGVTKPQKAHLSHFVTMIFHYLETKRDHKIEMTELFNVLMSFGITNEPELLEKTICSILNKPNLKTLKINYRECMKLLEPDSRVAWFRLKLREHVLNAKQEGIIISNYPQLINRWWVDIAKHRENTVQIEKVVGKIAELEFVTDRNEAWRSILLISKHNDTITYADFSEFFAESIFKATVGQIAERFYKGKITSLEMSPVFQIGAYKRNLMLSGLKQPNSVLPETEGVNAISAISKQYKELHRIECSELKRQILKRTGISAEQAENRARRIRT